MTTTHSAARWFGTGHPILWGGAIVGVLDILAAFAIRGWYGGHPIRVLQGIASGVLGPGAFSGGAASALLGLGLHFVIATTAAAVYYGASRRWPVLVQRAVLCGLGYGIVVYLVMNQVVLPLSRVGSGGSPPWQLTLVMIVVHMLCVGLPIALVVRRAELAGNSGIRLEREGV